MKNLQQNVNNTQELKNLITKNSHLFWFVPDNQKQNLSKESVLETIFNYGDINAVRDLLRIIGIAEANKIFIDLLNKSDRRKGNFHELTLNFFSVFFSQYAHRNI